MTMVDSTFWKGARVFLTGHTGFKGSWLSLWLSELGAQVTGYALAPPSTPSLFELAGVEQRLDHVTGDVRDPQALHEALCAARPDIVIHMAAQSLVRPSYEDPVTTYETNVMGTVHLLEAVRGLGSVKAALIVTSDKCYENREWPWGYRESDNLGGHDPYSNSKGCAELVMAAYRSSFFGAAPGPTKATAIASARAGNVLGGGDWGRDRLVPDIFRALSQGEAPEIRNPGAVRPWQHVLEPLSGYLVLLERLVAERQKFAEPWNFGPPEENAQPVAHVTGRIFELWGRESSWRQSQSPQTHEAGILKLDCSKARSLLGWRPQWDLEKTLQATVAWYRAHAEGRNTLPLILEQIAAYEAGS